MNANAFLKASDFGLPEAPSCPFCEGGETELHTAFGSAISVATYWCRSCRAAFDYFKADSAPARRSTDAPLTRNCHPDRAKRVEGPL